MLGSVLTVMAKACGPFVVSTTLMLLRLNRLFRSVIAFWHALVHFESSPPRSTYTIAIAIPPTTSWLYKLRHFQSRGGRCIEYRRRMHIQSLEREYWPDSLCESIAARSQACGELKERS